MRSSFFVPGLLALVMLSSFGYFRGNAKAEKKQPNIIVIMADDMGFSDIGCYGGEISTPNIDRLGRNGLRFTQFYNAARCCPSRASLLTGQYPHKAGIGEMISAGNYAGYLLPSTVTVAEALQKAGYNTYMSGKWHVGEDSVHWPLQRGFQKYYGLISGASSHYELDKGRIMLENNKRIMPGNDFYSTRAYTEKAVKYINEGQASKKPFFLYLAYTAPHWPLHAPEKDVQKYLGKYMQGWDAVRKKRYQRLVEEGIIASEVRLSDRNPTIADWEKEPDKPHWDRRMAVYAAMISIMDEEVGKIIATLEKQKALDNTLIFFLADNGGCAEVPHVYRERLKTMTEEQLSGKVGNETSYVGYEDRWANASNTPFRYYKQYIHEGGIASPLIVHWPDGINKVRLVPDVTHIMDIMPTCLAAAGAAYPSTYAGHKIAGMDGKSMLPLFHNQKYTGHESLLWEHFGNRGLREGKWKLVGLKNGNWELYDMETDRTETNDLAAKYPEKVKELNQLYLKKAAQAGVKMP